MNRNLAFNTSIELDNITNEVITPCYIYSSRDLINNISLLKSGFKGMSIYYALKANPLTTLVKIVSQQVHGMDVASVNELSIALSTGIPPENIIYGGPGKTFETLKSVIKNNVGLISIESLRELLLVEQIAAELNTPSVKLLVRINTSYRHNNAGEYMSGIPSQFGIEEDDLDEIWSTKLNFCEIAGIHIHSASQVLDHNSLVLHYKNCAKLFVELANKTPKEMTVLNCGGGIGIPYSEEDVPLDLNLLGFDSYSVIHDEFNLKKIDINTKKIILELGRAIIGDTGIFISKILDIKSSKGINYIITNGGITNFSRPSMHWAQQHRVTTLPCRKASSLYEYTIVGPSCLPSDKLCENAVLYKPKVGDNILLENAGAYGKSMSMLSWGGYANTNEYLYKDGETKIIGSNSTV